MGVPKPLEEKIIVIPEDIVPSRKDMEVIGVCNPGATTFHDKRKEKIYLLLRVVEKPKTKFSGHIASPRAVPNEDGEYRVRVDWERIGKDAHSDDPKTLIIIEPEERKRPKYISHFRLAESENGINFNISKKPTFFPQKNYEEFGVEDARITKLEELLDIGGEKYQYLISYVACSEKYDVATAFAVTNDFKNFVRLPKEEPRIIFFAPSKDVVLFPQKILNPRTRRKEFVALTRPYGQAGYMVPSIFISYSHDLIQWGDHELFVEGNEKGHVGAGPTPIECKIKGKEGWLIIDHQHRHLSNGEKEYIGRAYLVDKENPLKMLGRSEEILEPHLKVKNKPIVKNVTFPSGAVIKDNKIYIYTGEEDAVTGVHVYDFDEFMSFLSPV